MQNIYYSGSGASSILTLIEENNTISTWSGSILIVCGSLGEIVVISGSQNLVSFPINNTNIFYGVNYQNSNIPETSSIEVFSTLSWTFGFANLDPDYLVYDSPTYYISSSGFYYTASGSSATGSLIEALLPTGSYNIVLSSSFAAFPSNYSASIAIYNSTITSVPGSPGTLISSTSGSTPFSASLFLSASNSYTIAMFIQGTYGLS